MLFFDIETKANKLALGYMENPSAPSNWKDPKKIEAYIAEKREEQIEKAALDPDYGKIVAIGMKESLKGKYKSMVAGVDGSERDLIEWFWSRYRENRGYSCGYNILNFDLPYLMRRSFAMGIKPHIMPVLARYRTKPNCDLMQILFNWYGYKSMKWVAERYDLDNPLPELEGSQVKDMDADTLKAYVENDVYLVFQLWEKMDGVYF